MNRQDAKGRKSERATNRRWPWFLANSFSFISWRPWRLGGSSCLLAVLSLGCRPAAPATPPDPVWFADVTEEAGLNFVHDPGPLGNYFLPEVMGSGAAVFDFDGDGLPDLYLLQNGG